MKALLFLKGCRKEFGFQDGQTLQILLNPFLGPFTLRGEKGVFHQLKPLFHLSLSCFCQGELGDPSVPGRNCLADYSGFSETPDFPAGIGKIHIDTGAQ